MKKVRLIVVGVFSVIFLFSCSKDVVLSEDQQIENYITSKKLVVTEKLADGLRYIRTADGTGDAVKSGQTLSVKYAGKFLDDSQFDAGTFSFKLGGGQVIKGFDEGIAKMKIGEKATLIFPSTIGYGSTGNSSIPGNSPLLFTIEVVSAK
jgi:FKBP-type peptidyl-prolyl cis-trans isomerase